MRNHSEVCRLRIEESVTQEEEGILRKKRAEDRLQDQLTRALEREDELQQEQEQQPRGSSNPGAATEGEKFDISTPLNTPIKDDDMNSGLDLESPPNHVTETRTMTPVDVGMQEVVE